MPPLIIQERININTEKIEKSGHEIPKLILFHKIHYKQGYRHAHIKKETCGSCDDSFSGITYDVTPENMAIFDEMKALSDKIIPIRNELEELSKKLKLKKD